jgi:DNA polymerase-3 subunit alpha
MYIVFDTETTGKAKSFSAPVDDFNNWPRMVQIAWKVFDKDGVETDSQSLIIKPQGWTIPEEVVKIHRISTQRAREEGIPLEDALRKFAEAIKGSKYLIAHNIAFDENVVGCEYLREGMHNHVQDAIHVDTMKLTTEFVGIPNKRRGGFKFPSLTELHQKLFNKGFDDAHDALVDVEALARCFFELQKQGVLGYKETGEELTAESLSDFAEQVAVGMLEDAGILPKEEDHTAAPGDPLSFDREEEIKEVSNSRPLAPLGLHTFHSILEGAGSVDEYIKMAKAYGHTSMAITDNSTLSGAFEFFQKCTSKGIKPVFGIEILLNDNIGEFEDKSLEGDSYKMKILVKNEEGYRNLNKLIYLSNTEGYFKKEARITTKWLIENKGGLIVSTSGLKSKLAHTVLRGKEKEAEAYLNMLRNEFGDDLIVEIQFNKFPTQKQYNNFLLRMAKQYKLNLVLTNDTYYPRESDSILQDVVTSIKQHRPMHMCSLKENRELYYFSSEDFREMNKKYGFNYPDNLIDLCLDNTLKVADKCNFEMEIGVEKYPRYEPTEDVIDYFKTDVPEEIIKKLAFAKLRQKIKKYQENGIVEITDDKIQEYIDRLTYELSVIEDKKMLDYFLVNWEIINFYRKQGDETIPSYDIGPARGSAAGSLLSWCLDITKIDPIRFGLYFERFLNPERNSPPDIDIDFMQGTDHVTNQFLYDKYGKERVMSVGTFGTFSEKNSIKDVVRAYKGKEYTGFNSPVFKVTDEMPDFLKYNDTLRHWFETWPDKPECSPEVRSWIRDPKNKEIIETALSLQGNIRGIGQHAAGVVITPDVSWNYIPTNVIPTNENIVTAFQEADKSGKDLSALGILKLDRLKLETLNVIKETIEVIKNNKGKDVTDEVDYVDLEDPNLFMELRLGLNHGIFQFESHGMNNLIRGVRVEKFEELVACNALYRPGPMGIGAHEEYITNKFNPEKIELVHPALESILSETNGVLVFQEQLMFIADKIGGMGLGKGDMLRRYMDKASKIIARHSAGEQLTESEKNNKNWKGFQEYWNMFLEGAAAQGYDKDEVDKIKDWVIQYLGYSFNKSHSLSYSYLAMQTLYLKHYYPTEFYTALLNHPKSGTKEKQQQWIASAIASAMSKGIEIKPPSRKSGWRWTMTGDKEISMGFSGINGLGPVAYEEMLRLIDEIKVDEDNGEPKKTLETVNMSVFMRLPFSKFNKSAFVACLKAGVFDDWSESREQLLALKQKKKKKEVPNQMVMFDMNDEAFNIPLAKDENKYPPTSEGQKRAEFIEVCNFDLDKIKYITELKAEVNSRSKREKPVEMIINFHDDDYYIFVVDSYKMNVGRTGKEYLVMRVGDGISTTTLRAFEPMCHDIFPKLEKDGIFVAEFVKNQKGYINFKQGTRIIRIDQKKKDARV